MNKAFTWGVGGLVLIIVIVIGLAWARSSMAPRPAATQTPTGGAFVQQAPEETPRVSPGPTTSAKAQLAVPVTVSITDTGFEPATLTVPAGTTVTFLNNGQAAHWPASNPHPIHTGLSGFDATKALATGETYSFTFTKTGTWGFHDHLNTSLTGSVVVK